MRQDSPFILIASSDNSIIELLKKVPQDFDTNRKYVESINDLIKLIKKKKPNVVVLDEVLEGIESYKLLPIIKTMSADTNIVIISSGNDPKVEKYCRSQGIVFYCLKPYEISKIPQIICKAAKISISSENKSKLI